MADQALTGLRVVEFTDEIGSYAGRLLADLGADVIKVEPPGGGQQRHTPPFYKETGNPDTSITFWVQNTSKRSVVLDLDSPADQATARKLALSADVVIEDRPVGYLASRGLGYADLSGAKPSLVYTSVTGFGQTGPHATYAYTDIVGQAMGGILTLAGDPADPPTQIYGNQADVSASLHAANGTLMAVLHAEATGEGQLIDVSAQEALSMSQETAMQTWNFQKRNRVRTGEAGSLAVRLPGLGIYPASDGWVALMVLAPAGGTFADMIDWMDEEGQAGDLKDEPYITIIRNLNMAYLTQLMLDPEKAKEIMGQLAHINEVVKAFVATKTAKEMYEEGQGRRLLVGIVSKPSDLAENTQLRARKWFTEFELDWLHSRVEFTGPPYNLSETPAVISRPPRLGEHTKDVLAEIS